MKQEDSLIERYSFARYLDGVEHSGYVYTDYDFPDDDLAECLLRCVECLLGKVEFHDLLMSYL